MVFVASQISRPVCKIPPAFQMCHLGKPPPLFCCHRSQQRPVSIEVDKKSHWEASVYWSWVYHKTEDRLSDLVIFIILQDFSNKPTTFLKQTPTEQHAENLLVSFITQLCKESNKHTHPPSPQHLHNKNLHPTRTYWTDQGKASSKLNSI